jgi:hypothetical protein
MKDRAGSSIICVIGGPERRRKLLSEKFIKLVRSNVIFARDACGTLLRLADRKPSQRQPMSKAYPLSTLGFAAQQWDLRPFRVASQRIL